MVEKEKQELVDSRTPTFLATATLFKEENIPTITLVTVELQSRIWQRGKKNRSLTNSRQSNSNLSSNRNAILDSLKMSQHGIGRYLGKILLMFATSHHCCD